MPLRTKVDIGKSGRDVDRALVGHVKLVFDPQTKELANQKPRVLISMASGLMKPSKS